MEHVNIEMSEVQADYDYLVKVVFIGDSGVGKSNFITRLVNNEFNRESKTTIGVEFSVKNIKIGNDDIKVQIWDTSGQERYRTITSAYYRGSNACIIVYDITNRKSFENVKYWIGELSNCLNIKNTCLLLVGNKTDLNLARTVSINEGKEMAKEYGALFFETSVLNSSNVNEAFNEIIRTVHKQNKKYGQQQ